ncbi:ATP-binding cassette domain-containing protein [Candidatus Gracilibacteria bacterium]|nr:ATP-binding cassette domain-containing protein [Candidatus Gracilibacteria bacterium]
MKHLKIDIKKLELSGELILKDISFTLNRTDRVSIVGPNGAGKTTLLKVLTGEIGGYEGNIENIGNLRIGYLQQIYQDNPEMTIEQELQNAFREINELNKKIDKVQKQMEQDPSNMDFIETYSSLLEQLGHTGGHECHNKIHAVANGMGIVDLLSKKISEVSGGQRTKVALAKVLLESPDILFLDEPTNFIDMGSVEWLESYLNNKWSGGYVIISHDREFLDQVCHKTLEVQPQRPLEIYHTNYSDYVAERKLREKKKMDDYKREQEYIDKQENLINRFRAGSRAGWAKSREKMLDKMDRIEAPYIPKKPKFFFGYTGESPEKVMSFKEVFIGRQEPLFYIGDLVLYKKQRIGVVGENGVGKSTFIKSIIGQLDVLDGFYSRGKAVQINYYSQMHEELDNTLTVRENFEKKGIHYPEQQLIGLLKHYLFDKNDIDKPVNLLSGGQRSKLLFALLGQHDCNILILDEPTNHLDYDTREELEQALQKFEGTILFISHDRYFVNKLATNIWFIQDGELSVSYGNYEDYTYKKQHNLDMDLSLFDEEAQINLVLEEKLGEREYKRLKDKFGKKKRR